ncbi:hypothetical protein NCAS_0F03800 [Naumovozyma castellii]|uniref:Enhancer of mRNA-decapping protein 1 n=1 Tax=Naumovozyma castellii TaxID=27288 RepID=G0VH91_NAUCA|nr:hypothetical protein NCAS_0F03800 [Naumovozyma castellii CBS 4309]CCC70864.1 hypothetical protein NCAS_0F03800 [Naumovozyma castellii CBS 4309]
MTPRVEEQYTSVERKGASHTLKRCQHSKQGKSDNSAIPASNRHQLPLSHFKEQRLPNGEKPNFGHSCDRKNSTKRKEDGNGVKTKHNQKKNTKTRNIKKRTSSSEFNRGDVNKERTKLEKKTGTPYIYLQSPMKSESQTQARRPSSSSTTFAGSTFATDIPLECNLPTPSFGSL